MQEKKDSLKYKLLSLLAWGLDEMDEWVEIFSDRDYLYKSGFRRRYFDETLNKLIKEGFFEKRRVGDKKIFIYGKEAIKRFYNKNPKVFLAKEKWDGTFRAVAFDIPEKERGKRDLVRRRLKDLGFGMLQRSLWISPYPLIANLKEYFKKNKLVSYCLFLKSYPVDLQEVQDFVKRIWDLEKINLSYKRFIEKWQEGKEVEGISKDYFSIFTKDPFLPVELLPKDWLGQKAYRLYKERLKGEIT